MEIRNVISFIRIVKLGSFSKAARELGYSQSNVTMQIKQLEDELQVRLFDRIGKTVQLTEDGKKFLKYALEIDTAASNAKQALAPASEPVGELRIGLLESLCISYLPDILKEFHRLYPKVGAVIRIGTFEELATMLNTNAIDLLWTFDTEIVMPEWIREYEFTNPISIIASSSHPLAGSDELMLKDLALEPFILTEKICSYRDLFEQQFRAQGMDLKVFLEIGNTEIIKKFVGTGIALSVLPAFSLREELEQGTLCILPVTDFDLQMKGQVFCHRNKWITPAITEFIRLIKDKAFSSYSS